MNEDKDQVRRGGPALEKAYRFLLWVVPALEKFPRSQRVLLGDRIETTALAVLEGLVEATYSKSKKGSSMELINTGNDLFDPISELFFLHHPGFYPAQFSRQLYIVPGNLLHRPYGQVRSGLEGKSC